MYKNKKLLKIKNKFMLIITLLKKNHTVNNYNGLDTFTSFMHKISYYYKKN